MVAAAPDENREPFKADLSALVPRIKHASFLAGLKASGVPEDQWPHTEPLVADLLVTYAFDMPDLFLMMMPEHLKELNLEPGQLRALSLANMNRQIPRIALEELLRAGGARVFSVVTGNASEACVLLAPRFWNDFAAHVPGPVIAVPTRDVVLACSGASPESVAFLRELAAKAYDEGGAHALTKKLLTWKDGGLAEYQA